MFINTRARKLATLLQLNIFGSMFFKLTNFHGRYLIDPMFIKLRLRPSRSSLDILNRVVVWLNLLGVVLIGF